MPAAPPGPADLVVTPHGARFAGRRMPCAIGSGGVRRAAHKVEGDGATPAGRWRLTRGWWRADRLARPATALAMAPLGPAHGWSDDPADPAYNRPVRLPHRFGHERLRRADPLYDIVVATDHNQPPRPGAGSAIFLHCWRAPRRATAGCIALARRDLLWILAHWTGRSRVCISPVFSQGG